MAFNFTAASSQYLSTTSTPVSSMPCTLACWARVNSTSTNNTLITLQDADTQSRMQLNVNGLTTPKRKAQAFIADSVGTFGAVAFREDAYSTGTWMHIAGVFTSSTNVVAYADGAAGSSESGAVTPTGIDQILIATRFAGSLGGFQDGGIAEVGIWNVALTAAEIASLAKGFTPDKIRPQSLRFYAPLIRNLQDVRGGLAITNNNAATVANHPRIYA